MRALLLLNLKTLRGKYWLLPAIMALGAILLAFGVVALDRRVGIAWIEEMPWLYANGPTGARSLLSTIGGSMITVAGVTFSITMVAIANTSTTYGPRLIGNFMQDRGNQLALGTFIATFLFCILVLRTVQGEDGAADAFVPHLAVACAMLMAVASLGVLIYFMHHVPEGIHISNVTGRLGQDLIEQVDELFPEDRQEDGTEAAGGEDAARRGTGSAVRAGEDGYLRYIDWEGLVAHAAEHDLFVVLERRPGAFLPASDVVATVHAPGTPGEEVLEGVRKALVIGVRPSAEQDILFSVDRLVEVAGRALSPGMNDVYTAMNAIDWLGSGLSRLAGRRMSAEVRRDAEGRPRVAPVPWTFEEVVGRGFDRLRPYVAADRNAALQTMRSLAVLARHAEDPARRAVVLSQARTLRRFAEESLTDLDARETVAEAYAETVRSVGPPGAGTRGGARPRPPALTNRP